MGQIFISYSRADREFVDRLASDIEASELDVWIDRADIRAGEGWAGAISRAVRQCSSLLLVLSPDSSKSRNVVKEVLLADEQEKQIIPLKFRPCEVSEDLEWALAGRQSIDFAEDYDAALTQLLAALGSSRQPAQPKPKQPRQRPREDERPREPAENERPPREGAADPYDEMFAAQQPQQPPRAPQLSEVLPGRWQVTIVYPMMPPINVSVALGPDGSFWTQLPMGSTAQGRWGINQGNQVFMQGMETNGMMTAPYMAWLTVTNFTRDQINGVGSVGEPVIWRRVG